MEITAPFYGSMTRNWSGRRYQLLGVVDKDTRAIRLSGKRIRTWKTKVVRKLKLGFRILAPMKLLQKLREAYMSLMLRLAENVGSLNRVVPKMITKCRSVRKGSEDEEFQNKLILKICKAVKDSRELDSI
ncbi:hypothetical protein ACHQM5_005628 [Ranunculus cassubicifolius]